MKKAYIIPNTETEFLTEQETLLAGSPDGFANDLNDNETDAGNALSREIILFDED
jgi:hypothetical protein